MAIVLAFLALNYTAYDGFFQDDELDNLSWAPILPLSKFATDVIKPTFDVSNFRPPGHLYFTLAGRAFGMDFPPFMTPVIIIHLLNVLLLFVLLRKLAINRWCALAGAAFFALSASAMDAYWKPMYVFDLLCTTFSLASLIFWISRRWILSFVAFWLAYKSKELAVMLPAVLVAYEYWLGQKRITLLIPFLAASLSFGLQGLLLNPNKDNDYTFRFTLDALTKTVPFYAGRVFLIPFGGLALLLLAFVRDRRVWFGLSAIGCFLFTLLFLPGRLFEAYTYLPLTGAVIAMTAAASHIKPAFAWVAFALWMPWNYRHLHQEQLAKLAGDDEAFVFVDKLRGWAAKHPEVRTLVYTAAPRVYHDWGVTAAWNIAHHTVGLPALYRDWPQAAKAIGQETVAYATWDSGTQTLLIQIHSPG
ncbi:MAG: hypothetical protein QOJ99_4630 [Bryobacterales bacterium]|jgi:hypothetical protein|nr:hypothetical protein [Bryobacterales bacterium]